MKANSEGTFVNSTVTVQRQNGYSYHICKKMVKHYHTGFSNTFRTGSFYFHIYGKHILSVA